MSGPSPFTDEQLRNLTNLRQRYEVWRDAERGLRAIPYDLRRKTIGKYEYLYEIRDRSGNGTNLGPWDEERARTFADYQARKSELKNRRARARDAMTESGRLARAAGVPQVPSAIGPILREADLRGLLDGSLLVVGPTAFPPIPRKQRGVSWEPPTKPRISTSPGRPRSGLTARRSGNC